MTLDEAIKRYTDNAVYERNQGDLQGCLDFTTCRMTRRIKAIKRASQGRK